MFALLSGDKPVWGPGVLVILVSFFLAPGLSGCSSSRAAYQPVSNGPAVMSWRFFDGGEPQAAATIPRDMEDDGIPAQTPPPKSIRAATDDPTQPWSRNYGRDPATLAPEPGTASGVTKAEPNRPVALHSS